MQPKKEREGTERKKERNCPEIKRMPRYIK
jgi:hypothetical protein